MKNLKECKDCSAVLPQSFYDKTAVELAPLLLGKLLCRRVDGQTIKKQILETECYYGTEDTACHAHKGRTARTEILYARGGKAYIYLCYGIHCLLNVVTGEQDYPQAILIRAVDGYNGPGKLTRALKIDRSLNSENLVTSDELWLEDAGVVLPYKSGPRVGINYACDHYKNIHWRFIALS